MSNLEKHGNKDEFFFELNQNRAAVRIGGILMFSFSIFLLLNYNQHPDYNSQYMIILGTLSLVSAVYLFIASLKKIPENAGLYINKEGIKVLDIPELALKLSWDEIKEVKLVKQRNAAFTCFFLKNEASSKAESKSILMKINSMNLGTPLYINTARIMIKRDDLHPLIESFWNKYKN